jgi:hypothetical protein
MPVIEHNTLNAAAAPIEGDDEQRGGQREGEQLLFDADQPTQQQSQEGNYKNDLLDLMGLGGEAEQPAKVANNGNTTSKQPQQSKFFGLEDLLGGMPNFENKGKK